MLKKLKTVERGYKKLYGYIKKWKKQVKYKK